MKINLLFWDVDTQRDFMLPEGKLHISGAEDIMETISEIRRFALEKRYPIVASTDWHGLQNAEISQDPDYKETYPQHCLAKTQGAERVGYVGDRDIDVIGENPMDADVLSHMVQSPSFHLVIRKSKLDVFTNPNTTILVDMLNPATIIVFGVALDLCVSKTVFGLLERTSARLIVLKDAVRAADTDKTDAVFGEFNQRGVELSDFGQLREELSCGS